MKAELNIKWSSRAENQAWAVAASETEQFIVGGSWDNYVYFLDRNGTLLWKNKTGDYVKKVAISEKADFILAGSFDKNVYAYNKNGRIIWRFKSDSFVRDISIFPDASKVAIASWSGMLYCLDKNGTQLWTYSAKSPIISSSISPASGQILCATTERDLILLNPDSKEAWSKKVEANIIGVALTKDGTKAYYTTSERSIVCCLTSGRILWKSTFSSMPRCISLSPDGELILVGCTDKHIYCFDKQGNLLWIAETDKDIWDIALVPGAKNIIIASSTNEFIMYENTNIFDILLQQANNEMELLSHLTSDITDIKALIIEARAHAAIEPERAVQLALAAKNMTIQKKEEVLRNYIREGLFELDEKLKKAREVNDKKVVARLERYMSKIKTSIDERNLQLGYKLIKDAGTQVRIALPTPLDIEKMEGVPKPVFEMPINGEEIITPLYTIRVSVPKEKVKAFPIKMVQISFDNRDWLDTQPAGKEFSFTYPWSSYMPGPSTIYARAVSLSGNISEAVSISVNVSAAVLPVSAPVKTEPRETRELKGFAAAAQKPAIPVTTAVVEPPPPPIPIDIIAPPPPDGLVKSAVPSPEDAKKKPRCPSCGKDVDPRWNLCPFCHEKLGGRCPKCGAKIEEGQPCRYCPVMDEIEAYAQTIKDFEASGAYMEMAKEYIKKARESLKANKLVMAQEYAKEALESSQQSMERFTDITDIINEAEIVMNEAKSLGADVQAIQSSLQKAKATLTQGDYVGAEKLGRKALEDAKEAKANPSKTKSTPVLTIGKSGPSCPACGKRVNARWKLCPYCKTKLD
ncbi:MAG: PQQ-binding-like beta-propeller repeat protein [Thermoplasmata archaeon]